MSAEPPANRIYALRYAYRDAQRGAHFYGAIDDPTRSMPIHYFVWLIIGPDGPILVDTGFTAETAARYGRTYVAAPAELVARAGVDPAAIDTVVLTHLHYDHAGGTADFPNATFVLQDAEMAFWSGRHACTAASGLGLSHLVQSEDVGALVEANFRGRVRWIDGDAELAPGVHLYKVGGHTPGMQIVRVATVCGDAVLASDAAHFYDNLTLNRPYAVLDSVPGALNALAAIRRLATSPDLVVAGHDPAVLSRFPDLDLPALAGHAVRIA